MFFGLVKFLFEIIEQFAKFALRLRVVRMVRCPANGTSPALLELFAQLHDVFTLTERQRHIEALMGFHEHEQFVFGRRQILLFLLLRRLDSADFRPLVVDFLIARSNTFPERLGMLQGQQTVAVVGETLLELRAVVSLIVLAVDKQFAFERIHVRLVVVLLLLITLRRELN